MNTAQILGLLVISLFFLWIVLDLIFVVFIIKRLRRNPATKDALGMRLWRWGDVYNVAFILSLPRRVTDRIEARDLQNLKPKRSIIEQHVSKIEIGFARFYVFVVLVTITISSTLGYLYCFKII